MIFFNTQSIADVKHGSQQIAKVYHGSDLVWEKWVEYVFPNANAYMRDVSDYGFAVSIVRNSGESLTGSAVLGLDNDGNNSPRITNTRSGYSQHYRIVLPTQFQNAVFCNIMSHYYSYSDASVRAGNDGNFDNWSSWTQYGGKPGSSWMTSDFNAVCKRIDIKTVAPDTAYYMGSFHLKFKIKYSDLISWKNAYNVS